MNQVILMGNLGNPPELKVTANGNAILNFSIATSEKYLDKNNEKQERTDWHRCQIFGKRAEALAKMLDKGSRVVVRGRIRTDVVEKDDGSKVTYSSVAVDDLEFAGGGNKQESPSEKPVTSKKPPVDDWDSPGV